MSKRILICDDSELMRKTLADILTRGGYEIAGEAADGKQAVELYESLKPDLVLMDTVMPVTDGIQALKSIMQKDSNARIIICPDLGQQSMVIDAVKNGAKDFIVKPFYGGRLLESVGRCLK
ncbi:MAG: response regulator [Acutalibacteraceae bacterium]